MTRQVRSNILIHMALLESRAIPIRELFKRRITIPSFSVPFLLDEEAAVRMLEDIYGNISRGSYRLGSFVSVKQGDEYILFDGCGRYLTLSLLLSLLGSPLFNDLEGEWSEDERQRLKRAYIAMEKSLSFMDASLLLDFLLSSVTVIFIAVEDAEEAFFFFDSAVSRGRPLESADLLKAYHLCAMRSSSEEDKLKAIIEWESMDNEHLYALFDTLYVLRKWIRGEAATSFREDGPAIFKGLDDEKYPYLVGIEKKHFSLGDPILNGRHFFAMASYYGSLYPARLNEEIERYYPSLERNFRLSGGYDNPGDIYAYRLFLALLLLYADRFSFTDFDKAVKACFTFAFALRFDNPGFSWRSVNEYVLDNGGFFHTLLHALTPYEVYSFDFEEYYPDLKNAVHPVRGRIQNIDWKEDFASYFREEV